MRVDDILWGRCTCTRARRYKRFGDNAGSIVNCSICKCPAEYADGAENRCESITGFQRFFSKYFNVNYKICIIFNKNTDCIDLSGFNFDKSSYHY